MYIILEVMLNHMYMKYVTCSCLGLVDCGVVPLLARARALRLMVPELLGLWNTFYEVCQYQFMYHQVS